MIASVTHQRRYCRLYWAVLRDPDSHWSRTVICPVLLSQFSLHASSQQNASRHRLLALSILLHLVSIQVQSWTEDIHRQLKQMLSIVKFIKNNNTWNWSILSHKYSLLINGLKSNKWVRFDTSSFWMLFHLNP